MPIRRADDQQYALLVGGSATGAAVAIKGGEYQFMVDGTAGGTTASLQIQSPSGAWMDVQVFTGSVVKFTTLPGNQSAIDLPAGNVRCALTGGTPSGINAYLVGLG
jgi:phage-related tail protein